MYAWEHQVRKSAGCFQSPFIPPPSFTSLFLADAYWRSHLAFYQVGPSMTVGKRDVEGAISTAQPLPGLADSLQLLFNSFLRIIYPQEIVLCTYLDSSSAIYGLVSTVRDGPGDFPKPGTILVGYLNNSTSLSFHNELLSCLGISGSGAWAHRSQFRRPPF